MVGDEGRLELHRLLEEHLGPRAAGLLMEQLPPVGWPDLATKADLAQLGADLRTEMAGLRTEMASLRIGVIEVVNQQLMKMTWVMLTLMVTFIAGAFAVTRIP